jgi:hypothetical protein
VSCWIAPRDVRPGSEYASEIIDGIKSSAVFVLVLSEHANTSEFVKREVERAVSKGKPIFPVRVREVIPSKSLELFISSAEWIDAWQPPIEQYLERLAESIRSAAALYPVAATAGRGETTASEPAAHVGDRRGNVAAVVPPPAVSGPQPGRAQRAFVVAIVALLAVVVVLALLLVRNMTRPPETAGSTATAANPASAADPPAASASVVEQAATSRPQPRRPASAPPIHAHGISVSTGNCRRRSPAPAARRRLPKGSSGERTSIRTTRRCAAPPFTPGSFRRKPAWSP